MLDRQTQVLVVAGLLEEGQKASPEGVERLFEENIQTRVVDLTTGEYDDSVDAATYDQRKATKDPRASRAVPANRAGVARLPTHALVYQRVEGDPGQSWILPSEGKGLWATLYGYLALATDTTTIEGITFYEEVRDFILKELRRFKTPYVMGTEVAHPVEEPVPRGPGLEDEMLIALREIRDLLREQKLE